MTLILNQLQPTNRASASITDVTAQTLGHAVINASLKKLVLLQFWSPAHPHSLELTKILSKVQALYADTLTMTRINVDQSPEVAEAMGISTLPTVVAFLKGKPVDAFTGIPPEADLRRFIDRFLESPLDPLEEILKQAKDALIQGSFDEASALFIEILSTDPTHDEALLGLARCSLEIGDLEKAEGLSESLSEGVRGKPECVGFFEGLEVFKSAKTLDPFHCVDASDFYHRAMIALKNHAIQHAFDALLEGLKTDFRQENSRHRLLILKLFNYYGPNHPLTIMNRKALSKILFS
jgi:putative thioredoxin